MTDDAELSAVEPPDYSPILRPWSFPPASSNRDCRPRWRGHLPVLTDGNGVLPPAGALGGLVEAGHAEEHLEHHDDGEHADEEDQPVLGGVGHIIWSSNGILKMALGTRGLGA